MTWTTPTDSGFPPPVPPAPTAVQHIQPQITSAPSTAVFPTEVVVQLETTLLIPDYPAYYSIPVSEFNPNYEALPDGSLVTSPYRSDLTQANAVLLLLSILLIVFFRNVLIAGDYLRRIRVQKNILFQTTLVSQLVALGGLVPQIASFMNSRLNCTGVVVTFDAAITLSIVLVMSGVIGYKTYKCLDNSRIVLLMLSILTAGSIGVSVADLITLRGVPRLSGSCSRSDDMRWIKIFIVLQLGQSFFQCCCFLYAVWKSRHSAVARDRISVQLSMDFQAQSEHRSRQESSFRRKTEAVHRGTDRFRKTCSDIVPQQIYTIPENSTQSSPTSEGRDWEGRLYESSADIRPLSSEPAVSVTPSTFSTISHHMPQLFRRVMQDELWYTTIITACCAVVAIIAVVGVTSKDRQLAFMFCWTGLYWVTVSILAIHSLGRAVRRHERESLSQTAALNWQQRRWESDRFNRTTNATTTNRWIRRIASGNDDTSSLGDTRALTSNYTNRLSVSSHSDSPSSPHSFNSESSFPSGPLPTFQFPTSGRTTPLVPLDSTQAVLPGTGFILDPTTSASSINFNLKRTGSVH